MASQYEDWDDEPYDDDMTEEDEIQLREGMRQVKERIPDWKKYFSQRDAENVLWDNYYDIEKAVSILNKRIVKTTTSRPAASKTVAREATAKRLASPESDSEPAGEQLPLPV